MRHLLHVPSTINHQRLELTYLPIPRLPSPSESFILRVESKMSAICTSHMERFHLKLHVRIELVPTCVLVLGLR